MILLMMITEHKNPRPIIWVFFRRKSSRRGTDLKCRKDK